MNLRLRAHTLVLAVLASLLLVPAAHAQSSLPDPQPGVVVTDVSNQLSTSPGLAQSAGAKWVKWFVPYSTPDGALDEYNRIFTGYRNAGIKVVVILYGSKAGDRTAPVDPNEFVAFARKAAGKFRDSVHGYMVWNEADADGFWGPTANAAAYVDLLKRTYPVLKAVDPDGVVSFTPLTGAGFPFLEQAYKFGARGYFDVIGVDTDTACDLDSPYDLFRDPADNFRVSRYVFLGYREVRAVMVANGDANKKIWLEMGWSTSQKMCNQGVGQGNKNGGVSEADQALFLRQAYHCLREDNPSYVETAFWFLLREPAGADNVDNRFGLVTADNPPRLKPAFAAYQDFANGRDTITGTCGDLVGPEIDIKAPGAGGILIENQNLPISALVADPRGMGRVTFDFDGKAIASFASDSAKSKEVAYSWFGARDLPLGKHTITVTALDLNANPSKRTVEFEKISVAAALAARAAGPGFKKPAFTLGKVKCGKGRRCTIKGSFAGYIGLTYKNRISIRWMHRDKRGKYTTVHKGGANASKASFTFTQKLKRKGTWKAVIVFEKRAPYNAVNAKPFTFAAK